MLLLKEWMVRRADTNTIPNLGFDGIVWGEVLFVPSIQTPCDEINKRSFVQ